jgi:hypothetical protein
MLRWCHMPKNTKNFQKAMTSTSIKNKVPETNEVVINMGQLSKTLE